MKITAYLTDCCNSLKRSDEVVGVLATQDLLDKYKSFPTIADPSKTDIHYCTRCYTNYVITTANTLVDRKDNETEYNYTVSVHAFHFKQMVIANYANRPKAEKRDEKK